MSGALKIEYATASGTAVALFVETPSATKMEIGLQTVNGVMDELRRVCVTYADGVTAFASVPAGAVAAAQHHATQYQRQADSGTEQWWPVNAAFGFGVPSAQLKTVCVMDNGVLSAAEISGAFPRPTPTPVAGATTTITTTTTTTAPTGLLSYSGSTHTETQCVAAGGAVATTPDGTMCKFTSATGSANCPSGLTQAGTYGRAVTTAEYNAVHAGAGDSWRYCGSPKGTNLEIYPNSATFSATSLTNSLNNTFSNSGSGKTCSTSACMSDCTAAADAVLSNGNGCRCYQTPSGTIPAVSGIDRVEIGCK